MPTLYLVNEAPREIVCPPWCELTAQDHLAALAHAHPGDRDCLHERHLDMGRGARENDLILWLITAPDGTPSPDEEFELSILGESMSLEEAEEAARAILAAVELARSAEAAMPAGVGPERE
jgi:hypothetical protein